MTFWVNALTDADVLTFFYFLILQTHILYFHIVYQYEDYIHMATFISF